MQKLTDNYSYFFGNMTEEEQQYRDYFESDLENEPEDEFVERCVTRTVSPSPENLTLNCTTSLRLL